jgi:hypothetical protein
MNMKQDYETPEIEVIDVQIEKGFAGSLEDPEPGWDM